MAKKQPNAVCSWCQDNYDPKYKWCYSKGMIILEPLQPRRCNRYTGETVTEFNLQPLKKLAQARLKIS